MMVDLKKLFFSEISEEKLQDEFCYSDVTLNSVNPFKTPVKVKAHFKSDAGSVKLALRIDYSLCVPCDRCFEEMYIADNLFSEHILKQVLRDEEDDSILAADCQLDIKELVYTDIMLSLPTKLLCKEDCRGLCHTCGRNLNESSCDCGADTVDPRLAVLRQLLEN